MCTAEAMCPARSRLVDEGLGNSSYLVDLGDGRALAVDASRDLRALRAEAARRGLAVAFAADTHLHADFLSGAAQLAATDGAPVLASRRRAAASSRTRSASTGTRSTSAACACGRWPRPATPTSTSPSCCWTARAVRGLHRGSLIVGSAARTDLVAPDRTEELARAQYRSLRRLADLRRRGRGLADARRGLVLLGTAGGSGPSTIGTERATNALLRAEDEDAFVTAAARLPRQLPAVLPAARRGQPPRPGPRRGRQPRATEPGRRSCRCRPAAEVVDVRPLAAFAARPRPRLGVHPAAAGRSPPGWAGSSPDDAPLVIVREPDQDPAEIVWQARKIGYDWIVGELAGGIAAWSAAGLTTARIPLVGADELGDARVLDIRQDGEFAAGHVPGAHHVELGDARRTPRPCSGRADGRDVRSRRAGDGRREPAGPRRPPRRRRADRRAGGLGGRHRHSGSRPGVKRPPLKRGAGRPVELGLRQNLAQFTPARRGQRSRRRHARPGAHRPAAARRARSSGCTAYTAGLTYILAFGLAKAATNYFAGTWSDRFGRKPVLVAGWLVAVPVPLMLIWAPTWAWVVVANVLLGISQGLTWSTTVIMKIDLVGPARRGLAMGLNEAAGYGAVAVTALATGYLAEAYGLRPAPFLLGLAFAALGLGLSTLGGRGDPRPRPARGRRPRARADGRTTTSIPS